MTKLEKIEQDIASLNKAELQALSDWLEEFKAEQWDRQIEEDARAGKLDKLAEVALADHRAGLTKPL